MNEKEEQILDMLRHFWFIKQFISDKEFQRAICDLLAKKNPFLWLKDKFEIHYPDDINFGMDIFKFENLEDSKFQLFCDNLFCKFMDIDGFCSVKNSVRLKVVAEKDQVNNLNCQSCEEAA